MTPSVFSALLSTCLTYLGRCFNMRDLPCKSFVLYGQSCLLGLEVCAAVTHACHQREAGLSVDFPSRWPIRKSLPVCTLSQACVSARDALPHEQLACTEQRAFDLSSNPAFSLRLHPGLNPRFKTQVKPRLNLTT